MGAIFSCERLKRIKINLEAAKATNRRVTKAVCIREVKIGINLTHFMTCQNIVIILNVSFEGGAKLDVIKDFVPVGISQTFRNINQKDTYSIITTLPSLFYCVCSPAIHWLTTVCHTRRPKTVFVAVYINKNKNKSNPLPQLMHSCGW